MPDRRARKASPLLALLGPAALVAVWALVSSLRLFPESLFPRPWAVVRCLFVELGSGRFIDDAIASLFRMLTGFLLAVVSGLPVGLALGHSARAREALLPAVNFFRNISPLAWIPFAILWLGIGDLSVIFLIFITAVCPIVFST